MSNLVILEPAELFWKKDGYPYIWGLIPLRVKPIVVFNGGEFWPIILDFKRSGTTYRILMEPLTSEWSLEDCFGGLLFIWDIIRGKKPTFKGYEYFLEKLYERWPDLEDEVKNKDKDQGDDIYVLMFKNWFEFIRLTDAVFKNQVQILMNRKCKQRMREISQQLLIRMRDHARDGEQMFVGGIWIGMHSLTVEDLTAETDGSFSVFGDPIKMVRPLFCTFKIDDWCPATWVIETGQGHSMGLLTLNANDRVVVRKYLSSSPMDLDFNASDNWENAGEQIIKMVTFFEQNEPYYFDQIIGGGQYMQQIEAWYEEIVKANQQALMDEAEKMVASFKFEWSLWDF